MPHTSTADQRDQVPEVLAAAVGLVGRLNQQIAELTQQAQDLRTCHDQNFINSSKSPWTDPTNNATERALRQAVIWPRTSGGTNKGGGVNDGDSNHVTRCLSAVSGSIA
jgi:hypothetical protein